MSLTSDELEMFNSMQSAIESLEVDVNSLSEYVQLLNGAISALAKACRESFAGQDKNNTVFKESLQEIINAVKQMAVKVVEIEESRITPKFSIKDVN